MPEPSLRTDSPSTLAIIGGGTIPPAILVGGSIHLSTGAPIQVRVYLTNNSSTTASFNVGDVALIAANGRRLRILGVSEGDSPIIARFPEKSMESTAAIDITVPPGMTFRLNICVATTPSAFPMTLKFGTATTKEVIEGIDELNGISNDSSGSSVSLAGAITIEQDVPSQKVDAGITGNPSLVHFESVSLTNGDQIPAAGSRSITSVHVDGMLNGQSNHEEVPEAVLDDNDHSYVGGTVTILGQISQTTAEVGVESGTARFSSGFRAQKNDVLGGMIIGQTGTGSYYCILSSRKAD